MDFRGNQASNSNAGQGANAPKPPVQRFGPPASAPPTNGFGPQHHGKKKMLIVGAAALVVVIFLIFVCMWAFKSMGGDSNSQAAVKSDKYQAVFLTNGQVYFGKLTNADGEWAKLTDIYYLQVQQSVQPSSANSNGTQTQSNANQNTTGGEQPKVSLAKLGSELHGPEDEMQISRDQILFWENLTDDSKAVKAINEHKSK